MGPEVDPLATAPRLAGLAAGAAVIDLLVNRVAIRALTGRIPHARIIQIAEWGTFARNVVAVAGLVALTLMLLDLLRAARFVPLARRLFIAVFAGLLFPSLAVATFFPRAAMSEELVKLGIGAANVLAVMLGLTALRFPSRPAIRGGLALAVGACVCSFGALVFALLAILMPDATYVFLARRVLATAGEVVFLLAPLVIAGTVFPLRKGLRPALAIAAAAVATVVSLTLLQIAHGELRRGGFADVLYGALRFELLIETIPSAYSSLIASAIAIGVAGALNDEKPASQGGIGLLLFYCAGFDPGAPVLLLMRVLGIGLIARSCLALVPDPVAATEGTWMKEILDEPAAAKAEANTEAEAKTETDAETDAEADAEADAAPDRDPKAH